MAQVGSSNQYGGFAIPIARRSWFTAPNSPLSRTNHRIATATPDRTAGM